MVLGLCTCMAYTYTNHTKAIVEGKLNPAYVDIITSIRLLVFFATPHLGGNYSGIGNLAAKLVRTGLGAPSNDLLDGLKSGSRDVIRRFEQARYLPDACLVISFYETLSYGRLGLVRYQQISYACIIP